MISLNYKELKDSRMEIIFNEKFKNLETKRLELVEFSLDYLDEFYKLRSNKETMKGSEAFIHRDVKQSKEFIENTKLAFSKELGLNWMIVEKETKNFLGYIGIWKIEKWNFSGEIGYGLDKKYWKKGFMREAVEKVLEVGFSMNLNSIVAMINPKNLNSKNVLLRSGFKKEGYFREDFYYNGEFSDSERYSILRREFKKS